jgi:PleD family two-component response regulator
MLQRSVRAEDIACRYGGEEFALILPECSLLHATVRAEEISMRIREYRPQNEGQANADQKNADQKNAGQKIEDQKIERQKMDALTVSIGVAAFDETTDRVDLLLKFADDALYDAKRAGRARVVVARPGVALPELNLTEKNPVPTT